VIKSWRRRLAGHAAHLKKMMKLCILLASYGRITPLGRATPRLENIIKMHIKE
jgi:hypothetical protein